MFHLYDIQDVIHSSSDGQRMETQIDTINARYSPKYFGLQKGVSAYTLVANHVPREHPLLADRQFVRKWNHQKKSESSYHEYR